MSESVKVDVFGANGKSAGKADLPAEIFDVQTNIPLIHQVVVAQQAASRQGTHSTKTRGEVRGGGAKPWRQKGTGRARHGSTRSPIWTGGGIAHGPQPRNYAQKTNKKMIAAALRGALSDRARDGRIFVLEQIVAGETPSTKSALAALAAIGDVSKMLVVLDRDEDIAWLSLRNLDEVHTLAVDQLNTYDVLVNDSVVFTSAALEVFTAGPVKGKAVKAVATETEAAAEAKPAKKAAKAAAPKAAKVEADEIAETKVEVNTLADVQADDASDLGEGSYRGEKPPAGYDIKGNEDSMKFHTPESPYYSRTVAEVWFNSVEAAEAAGFVSAQGDEGAEEETAK